MCAFWRPINTYFFLICRSAFRWSEIDSWFGCINRSMWNYRWWRLVAWPGYFRRRSKDVGWTHIIRLSLCGNRSFWWGIKEGRSIEYARHKTHAWTVQNIQETWRKWNRFKCSCISGCHATWLDFSQLFCYVSTSYCHLQEKMLMEKPYPPPADPHKIIKSVEFLDDDVVNAMTKRFVLNLRESANVFSQFNDFFLFLCASFALLPKK